MNRELHKANRCRGGWLHYATALAGSWALGLSALVWAQAGSLDPSFDGDGQVVTDVPGGPETAYALVIQSDGKLVAAGDNGEVFQLARYNPDGSLDASFGTGGLIATDFAPGLDTARALIQQADGKLVAGGRGNFAQALARYNPDGSLDVSFGAGGTITHNILSGARVTDLALQADGKLVAGITGDFIPFGTSLRVARFNADGSLDAGFGTGGFVQVPFPSGAGRAWAVAVQADGKIVAGGDAGFADIALARLNPDGSLDAGFGSGGVVETAATAGADVIRDIVLQADGKIVATGAASGDFVTLRYNTDGSLDGGFNGGGWVITDFAAGNDQATAVQLQADGKIIAAGLATTTNADIGLARYNTDGTLDASFGSGGLVTTDNGGSANRAHALGIQADGKPVIAGQADPSGTGNNFALARYQADAADLALTKSASAATVTAGSNFGYLFTVTNNGPGAAENVTLEDLLPVEVTFVSCSAPDGSCMDTGTGFEASFANIPAGENRAVTLTVQLSASAPHGTVVTNDAAVASETADPELNNNIASASITVQSPPHTLRFYLHGNDIPGTAGGFTMNLQPATPPTPLAVNLLSAPKWYSDPALSGEFQAGNFQLRFPCTLSLGLLTNFAVHRTDLNGGNAQALGSTTQLLTLCSGQTTINIPVNSAQEFNDQRLRLTVSALLGLHLNLALDQNTWLQTTSFVGTP